jgi:hypothetical protein
MRRSYQVADRKDSQALTEFLASEEQVGHRHDTTVLVLIKVHGVNVWRSKDTSRAFWGHEGTPMGHSLRPGLRCRLIKRLLHRLKERE